jgi:hypothetical protein
VLAEAAEEVLAIREAEAAAAAAAKAAAAAAEAAEGDEARVLDALRRSPLMLDLPAGSKGLEAIAGMVRGGDVGAWGSSLWRRSSRIGGVPWHSAAPWPRRAPAPPYTHQHAATCASLSPPPPQPDDLVVAACTQLLREHGLLDAKALVASDAEVLVAAAEAAQAKAAAEAAAAAAEAEAAALAAEAEAAAEAAAAVPVALPRAGKPTLEGVLAALERSPLQLSLQPGHPGLDAISDMVRARGAAADAAGPGLSRRARSPRQSPGRGPRLCPPHARR